MHAEMATNTANWGILALFISLTELCSQQMSSWTLWGYRMTFSTKHVLLVQVHLLSSHLKLIWLISASISFGLLDQLLCLSVHASECSSLNITECWKHALLDWKQPTNALRLGKRAKDWNLQELLGPFMYSHGLILQWCYHCVLASQQLCYSSLPSRNAVA